MATLIRTKSEAVPTIENDLAASVPAPFPAFARVQSSRGAPSILLSQPQQQGSTQQPIDVNVDVSQQPALPVGVEVAETVELGNTLVGWSPSRRCLGSFSRSVGGSSALCYSCHPFEHPNHRGNHQRHRESDPFLHIGLSNTKHNEYSLWTVYSETLPSRPQAFDGTLRQETSYQTRPHALNHPSTEQMVASPSPVSENEAVMNRPLAAGLKGLNSISPPEVDPLILSTHTQCSFDIRFPHHPLAFFLATEFMAR